MKKSEFMRKLAAEPRWAPGWNAIEETFRALYPGAEPEHLGTAVEARAALGGDQHLDGYSFYPMPGGGMHIVTFGLSELYGAPRAFGGEWSGRGCELTVKVREGQAADALWACDLLSALAGRIAGSRRHPGPYQLFTAEELGIAKTTDTLVRAVLLIPDDAAGAIRTVYGEVQFLRVLALTEKQAARLLAGGSVMETCEKEMRPHIGEGFFDWQNG